MSQTIDYEALEKEGRLLVLPVGEGATVWEIQNNTDACCDCDHFVLGHCCDNYCDNPDVDIMDADCCDISSEPICPKQFWEIFAFQPKLDWIVFHRKDFGKTVFTTEEDAKNALWEVTHQ